MKYTSDWENWDVIGWLEPTIEERNAVLCGQSTTPGAIRKYFSVTQAEHEESSNASREEWPPEYDELYYPLLKQSLARFDISQSSRDSIHTILYGRRTRLKKVDETAKSWHLWLKNWRDHPQTIPEIIENEEKTGLDLLTGDYSEEEFERATRRRIDNSDP
ncbi:uncharacterized protein L201_003705 [Kwoniella dendrophila CBS 6074]|uniref:Uncharacterized protein n=1 Tax=Kwoniella dendrophila CBS 6074 TaxID=1295534 RepID=A0AAX4JTV6_9TREE